MKQNIYKTYFLKSLMREKRTFLLLGIFFLMFVSFAVVSAEQSCSDSDYTIFNGGKNPNTFGTVTTVYNGYTSTIDDECISSSTLRERFCDGNWGGTQTITCASNRECKEGLCVLKQEDQQSCSETDGGINEFKAGSVTTIYDGYSFTIEDECLSNTNLRERFCDGNWGGTREFECLEGCEDGACKKKPLIPSSEDIGESIGNTFIDFIKGFFSGIPWYVWVILIIIVFSILVAPWLGGFL